MIRLLMVVMAGSLILLASPSTGMAKVTETHKKTVTPSGVIIDTTYVKGTGSDDLAVGDPYGNKPLSQRALQGPPNTQKSYGPECTDPECVRARNRQLSSPYWSPKKK